MTTEITNRKLSQPQRMQVLAMMARGDSYKQINEFLNANYGIQLSPTSLSETKSTHSDTIEAMRATIQESVVADASKLLKQSHRILGKKLDRAEEDMTALEQLDKSYRTGEIDHAEYNRKRKAYISVSITEIAAVSKNLHEQTKTSADTPNALPSGASPLATEALLEAIKNGDTVLLQQLTLNPQN